MTAIARNPRLLLLAMLAGAAPASLLAAQPPETPPRTSPDADLSVNVPAPPEAAATPGPRIEGIITARHGDLLQVMTADGTRTMVALSNDTRIRSRGGFLSLGRPSHRVDYARRVVEWIERHTLGLDTERHAEPVAAGAR